MNNQNRGNSTFLNLVLLVLFFQIPTRNPTLNLDYQLDLFFYSQIFAKSSARFYRINFREKKPNRFQ